MLQLLTLLSWKKCPQTSFFGSECSLTNSWSVCKDVARYKVSGRTWGLGCRRITSKVEVRLAFAGGRVRGTTFPFGVTAWNGSSAIWGLWCISHRADHRAFGLAGQVYCYILLLPNTTVFDHQAFLSICVNSIILSKASS